MFQNGLTGQQMTRQRKLHYNQVRGDVTYSRHTALQISYNKGKQIQKKKWINILKETKITNNKS